MLPRAHRIRSRQDIAALARRGQAIRGPHLTLRIFVRPKGPSRFVCSISQKVSKKATERNRLRRQLQEIIRHTLPSLTRPSDGLVLVRPEALHTPFPVLRDEVHLLFERAKLLQKKT